MVSAHEQQRAQQRSAARVGPVSSIGEIVGDLVGDFISGRPFSPEKVGQTLNDLGWNLGGVFGGGFSPPIDTDDGQQQQAYVPPENREERRWQQHQERHQPPPPPTQQASEEVMRARRDLGLGPKDPIDEDMIKKLRQSLARKYHPDLAGTDERKRKANDAKMRTVNNACDVLIASLERR